MARPRDPLKIALLELDIDIRLADLWEKAGAVTDWNLEAVAAFIRVAYGKGYTDALQEDKRGERSKLTREHGYRCD